MTKAVLKENVQGLIVKVRTKEALEQIKKFIDNSEQDYNQLENAILMQMASLSSANQQKMSGLVTDDDFNRLTAKVNYATLKIVEQIDEDDEVSVGGGDASNAPPTNSSSTNEANTRFHDSEQNKIKVLFLTANPEETYRLKLDKEIRLVKNGFKSATQRERFEFISEPAVTIADITMAITSKKPQIIHFSGHGSGKDGLKVEGNSGKMEYFTTESLSMLFNMFKDKIECVVLNACSTEEQAIAISKVGIESKNTQKGIHSIGTNSAIGDLAAINFSRGFYQAIGEGLDYKFAFQMGLVHVNDSEAVKKSEIWFNGENITNS